MLFSLCYGLLLLAVTRLFPNRILNRVLTALFLLLTSLCYIVEFFVYRSFKVFYDVDTVINGAGGVASGFMGDVGRLVFCYDGISRLVLFLLPFILYLIFLKKDKGERLSFKILIPLLGGAALLFAVTCWGLGLSEPYRLMYGEEYSFQNVVESYGLSTGIRLDVKKMVSGSGMDFELSTGDSGSQRKGDLDHWLAEAFPEKDRDEKLSPSLLPETGRAEAPEDRVAMLLDAIKEKEMAEGDEAKLQEDEAHQDTEEPDETTGEENTEAEEEIPGEPEIPGGEYVFEPSDDYGVNALPLDFAALAENASGKTRDLDLYVDSLEPSSQNAFTGLFRGKNLIFITAEAFSGDIIDPELTPTLYRLANNGIRFTDYYQPAIAGTTGGEYAHLFGLIPSNGGKSMKQMTSQNTWITIGNRLNDLGYYGRAYHDNTYTVYGRDETHFKLGYSDGFWAMGNGMEEYVSYNGFPESDLEMMQATIPQYIDRQPFNVYYMTVSGHGQYGRSINKMSAKNYDRVADLPYSEIVKCYIANNLELEDAMTYLVNELEKSGIADDTVIVLGADHFPYSLDNDAALGHMPYLSELYGYDVVNYLQRDHNRLIIWSGCLEDHEPVTVSSPVFSLDVLPTVCNLFGVDFDSRLLPGRDVFSDREAIVFNGGYDWKTDLGTYISAKNQFIPVSEDTEIPEDYVTRIKSTVRNRMSYCSGVLSCNYFDHVFGPPG